MKLHRATCYAIHALACLAAHEGLVASHDIARAKGIPAFFMLKVLHPLVSARVLLSITGPNGGYRLARPADEITLLGIVEAVEGPIRGDVPFTPGHDANALDRRLQEICDREAEHVRRRLGKVRLSDLIGKGV